MTHTQKTLGEFLTSTDQTIKRNALSILKRLQEQEEQRQEAINLRKNIGKEKHYGQHMNDDGTAYCRDCQKFEK